MTGLFEIAQSEELDGFAATVRAFVEREIAPVEDELRAAGATGIPPEVRAELQRKAKAAGAADLRGDRHGPGEPAPTAAPSGRPGRGMTDDGRPDRVMRWR
jgi:alkylation response protein AidB-like acyl-CoA dehydrogenase